MSKIRVWHHSEKKSEAVQRRNLLLYNALLYKIVNTPSIQFGTNADWITKHYPKYKEEVDSLAGEFAKEYGVSQ